MRKSHLHYMCHTVDVAVLVIVLHLYVTLRDACEPTTQNSTKPS